MQPRVDLKNKKHLSDVCMPVVLCWLCALLFEVELWCCSTNCSFSNIHDICLAHNLLLPFAGPFGTKQEVSQLIASGGGTVISRLPPAGTSPDTLVNLVVLVDTKALAAASVNIKLLLAPAVLLNLPIVAHSWLMDSISCFQVLCYDEYRYFK